MNNKFCPRDCKHLSITEEKQNMFGGAIDWFYKIHLCCKYNERVFHLGAHPDLYKCKQCVKEDSDDR